MRNSTRKHGGENLLQLTIFLTFLLEKPVCAIFDDDVISQRVKGLEAA